MPGLASILQTLFKRLGLLVLSLNIVLVSIPRCDLVAAVLSDHGQATVDHDPGSCHDSSVPADAEGPLLTSQRFCECAVFSFMAFDLPDMNISRHLVFRIQSERLLTFPWKAHPSDFQPLIEPPYPKV